MYVWGHFYDSKSFAVWYFSNSHRFENSNTLINQLNTDIMTEYAQHMVSYLILYSVAFISETTESERKRKHKY